MIVNLDLDENTADLLKWLADACKLTVSEVADRLFSGQLEGLWDLRTYLEAHSLGSEKFKNAANLLVSYGPEKDLTAGLKRIDPTFQTLGDLLEAKIEQKT